MSIGGIIIGLCIPNPKEKDSVDIVNDEPLPNDVVEKKDEKITSKLKEEDVSKLENIIKLLNFLNSKSRVMVCAVLPASYLTHLHLSILLL